MITRISISKIMKITLKYIQRTKIVFKIVTISQKLLQKETAGNINSITVSYSATIPLKSLTKSILLLSSPKSHLMLYLPNSATGTKVTLPIFKSICTSRCLFFTSFIFLELQTQITLAQSYSDQLILAILIIFVAELLQSFLE